MVPYSEAKRLITAAVFEDDAIVYVKGRESVERKGYRLLPEGPPSPPPKKKEEARYWECPGEKASKSSTSSTASRGAFTEQTLQSDGYGLQVFEIEISVGPPSYVEIALRVHRGHELSLSLETWKGLYEQRWNIYKMLRSEHKDNFISVGLLTVRVCTLNDATLVRLDSSSIRITMTETTLRRMFAFDECIDVTFERLVRLVDMVDVKYTRFSNIASEDAIRDSNIFNGHQLVDCELLALVFNTHGKKPNVIICE
ncbi:hypothetical protein ALC57_03978 [Trachymyrmex cornetzi]|uniref:Uncharacterized protein n=1 Tax=Trachymyrmex cornetzi TaxID=471704 RepID=A0A151JLP3_9HYME|nr:hypothetical protein ALC57_03978 [Trachymyrmex cornetzi]